MWFRLIPKQGLYYKANFINLVHGTPDLRKHYTESNSCFGFFTATSDPSSSRNNIGATVNMYIFVNDNNNYSTESATLLWLIDSRDGAVC